MNTIMKTEKQIQAIRKSQGITQTELAEALHVSRQEVLCDIFTETNNPSILPKIEFNIQKFSPEKQAQLLDIIKYITSRLA